MVLREHTTLPELPRNIQIVFIFHKIDSGWWPLGMRLEHSKIKLGEPHQERECVFVFNINIPLSLVEASYKQMVFTSDNMDIFFLAVLLWQRGGVNLLSSSFANYFSLCHNNVFSNLHYLASLCFFICTAGQNNSAWDMLEWSQRLKKKKTDKNVIVIWNNGKKDRMSYRKPTKWVSFWWKAEDMDKR